MAKEAEVQRVRRLLELLVRAKAARISALENSLGVASGYLNRIFSGAVMLKYEHVLDILDLLEVPYGIFFRTAYSVDEPVDSEEIIQKIQALSVPDPLPPNTLSREDVEETLKQWLDARFGPRPTGPEKTEERDSRRPKGR
jgi:transcriptional regulator with XRE-family HTH domain